MKNTLLTVTLLLAVSGSGAAIGATITSSHTVNVYGVITVFACTPIITDPFQAFKTAIIDGSYRLNNENLETKSQFNINLSPKSGCQMPSSMRATRNTFTTTDYSSAIRANSDTPSGVGNNPGIVLEVKNLNGDMMPVLDQDVLVDFLLLEDAKAATFEASYSRTDNAVLKEDLVKTAVTLTFAFQ